MLFLELLCPKKKIISVGLANFLSCYRIFICWSMKINEAITETKHPFIKTCLRRYCVALWLLI
jgi:hypothetical protein